MEEEVEEDDYHVKKRVEETLEEPQSSAQTDAIWLPFTKSHVKLVGYTILQNCRPNLSKSDDLFD
jgi:hypothetical protein